LTKEFYRRRVQIVTHGVNNEVSEETVCLLIEKTTDDDEADTVLSINVWICWDAYEPLLEDLFQWTTLSGLYKI